MSRSSYVYVAFDSGGDLRGTFTVKHELASWLRRCADVDGWSVWRWRDGNPDRDLYWSKFGTTTRLDLQKLLESEV